MNVNEGFCMIIKKSRNFQSLKMFTITTLLTFVIYHFVVLIACGNNLRNDWLCYSACYCKTCGVDTLYLPLLPKPRYRPDRQPFLSLLTLMLFLYSSRTVIPTLSRMSGVHECDLSGRLWEDKAGAPWSSRWQCFSSGVRGPSQHRSQHLLSH